MLKGVRLELQAYFFFELSMKFCIIIGHKILYAEKFITVYKSVKEAAMKHKDVSVLVNFASLRSAYQVTMETMQSPECKGIHTIAIIAEGIPENMTRKLLRVAKEKEITIIGRHY